MSGGYVLFVKCVDVLAHFFLFKVVIIRSYGKVVHILKREFNSKVQSKLVEIGKPEMA